MFTQTYQQELANLRELGAEFAEKHPALAGMLNGNQADPDVERLLEGTAFLTALIRQKLDDEFPEVIQDLMQIVAPHYLKPLPSATIQVFHPKSTVKHSFKLAAGVQCISVPVDGVPCLFRTSYATEIHPLAIIDAAYVQRPGQPSMIKIVFELTGLALAQWKPESVRLYLADDLARATELYRVLRNRVRNIQLVPFEGGRPCVLDAGCLKPVGFEPGERLIPCPSHAFPGYGVLQDYFLLPQKFLFLDLTGWERWHERGSSRRFEVHFEMDEANGTALPVTRDSFLLHATPAVNLFTQEADPIYLDHLKSRYRIRPSGAQAQGNAIFSVDDVRGFVQGTCQERTYEPFDIFRPGTTTQPVYHLHHEPSPLSGGVDLWLSTAYPAVNERLRPETLSIRLTCTNGLLAGRLRAGDIAQHGKGCPEYLTFTNLMPPTPGAPSPVGKNLLWRLLSHLSTSYQSLERDTVLRSMLQLYVSPEARDAAAQANRKRIESIQRIQASSGNRLVSGMVMRGRDISVTIREDHFTSLGDAYLFGCILDTFFGNYASINSFTRLTLSDLHGGSPFTWPPRMGNRALI